MRLGSSQEYQRISVSTLHVDVYATECHPNIVLRLDTQSMIGWHLWCPKRCMLYKPISLRAVGLTYQHVVELACHSRLVVACSGKGPMHTAISVYHYIITVYQITEVVYIYNTLVYHCKLSVYHIYKWYTYIPFRYTVIT